MRSSLQVIGALTLTLASIILLSGIWCIFLSPTMDYTKHIDSFYYMLSIEGLKSKSITFPAEKGETIDIGTYRRGPKQRFDVRVLDPDGILLWQELNVTGFHHRFKALKSGTYKLEVRNLGLEAISIPISIVRSLRITIRFLEPFGQWLSLISLPIFMFGVYIFIARRREGR